MTGASTEATALKRKDQSDIKALIDFRSKVNTMTPVYTLKLGFSIQKTDVQVQKIDGSVTITYGMVIIVFWL